MKSWLAALAVLFIALAPGAHAGSSKSKKKLKCPANAVLTKRGDRCECKTGFVPLGMSCVKPAQQNAFKAATTPAAAAPPISCPANATAVAGTCRCKTGYIVDATTGACTLTSTIKNKRTEIVVKKGEERRLAGDTSLDESIVGACF